MCWQLLQSALTQGTYSHSDSQAMGRQPGHTLREQIVISAQPLLAALMQLCQKGSYCWALVQGARIT